jgi:alkylation response protein AidB-like acyl-CoA dehydrogenase
MDLRWSAEEEAFRARVRDWLDEHWTNDYAKRGQDAGAGEELGSDDRAAFEFRREWQRMLADGGYLALHWPSEYGGGGATLVEQTIFNEEYARVGAPIPVNGLGINLVGPTLIVHGTEEQRQRYLRNILTAEEIWCQGYSEPNAGSDLAGLQTRAEIHGDEFVINGQKIWTTLARYGDWIFTLCRTDPSAPKHQGISYILVDMNQPGVEARPIKQISGTSGFGEVFFTDARAPMTNLVGKLNDGWRVANTTLMFERGANLLANQVRYRRLATKLRETATKAGRIDDTSVRQKVGKALVEVEVMRYNGLRQISPRLKGEAPGSESSIAKLYWSEWYRRATDVAMEILGPYGRMYDGPDDLDADEWIEEMFGARAATIYAGTSEIQRNIIAERVLGLPKGART